MPAPAAHIDRSDAAFVRIGPEPGNDRLAPWPWNSNDVLLTEGMTPTGVKTYDEQGITLGTWACNAGAVKIEGHPVDEVCFVTKGAVTITDETGRSATFGPGEGFLLPRGFRGTWSQSEGFSKLFVGISRP